MPQHTNKITQFWEELKRRKVVRVSAMYAGVAYIIIELINNIAEPLQLPAWTATMVILLLVIGFPIIVILSWIFDITPEGVKKTESIEVTKEQESLLVPVKRRLRVSDFIIALLLVVVVILAYPKIFTKDKLEDIRDLNGRISVAVMPFQNLTVDTLYNVWQEGIQNLLINKLSNSEELSVRQSQTMFDILKSTEQTSYASITPSFASEIAQKLETNTFIIGNILKAGNKIRISAQLRDATTEEIYKSYEIDGNTEDDFFNITDSLSNLLKEYLEIQVLKQDVSYDYWASTSSAEAFRYYIQGLNSYFAGDYKSAVEILNKAIIIDTSFFAAYDWLLAVYDSYGHSYQDYDQIELAKHLLNKLMGWEIDKLSRIDQLSFKMTISEHIDKNPLEYIRNCELILEYDPQQRWFWNNLGLTYSSIYQYKKAIKAFEKSLEISKQWGVSDKSVSIYVSLGKAYHEIGNHSREKEVYELGLSNLPDEYYIIWHQAFCALSLGDTTAANKYIAKYKLIRKDESFGSDAQIIHRLGHLYGRAKLFDKAEETWRKALQLEPQSTYHMRCFAEFLILNDINVEEGMELVNRVLEINPDYYDILYFKGWGLYKQGHLEQAVETLNIAWDKRFSYRHDHYLAIQEVEQALANQNK